MRYGVFSELFEVWGTSRHEKSPRSDPSEVRAVSAGGCLRVTRPPALSRVRFPADRTTESAGYRHQGFQNEACVRFYCSIIGPRRHRAAVSRHGESVREIKRNDLPASIDKAETSFPGSRPYFGSTSPSGAVGSRL